MTSITSWFHRGVLLGLLILAYLCVWSPTRTAILTYATGPTLIFVEPEEGALKIRERAQVIRVRPDSNSQMPLPAPAGIKFLLAACVLIVISSVRPSLGFFFTGHILLNGLVVVFTATELMGVPGGLTLADFVRTYLTDAYSLAIPVVVLGNCRARRRLRTYRRQS